MPRGFWAVEDVVYALAGNARSLPQQLTVASYDYLRGEIEPRGFTLVSVQGQRFRVTVKPLPPIDNVSPLFSRPDLEVSLPFPE